MIEATKYRSFICLLVWAIYVSRIAGGKFPENQQRCRTNDGECLKEVINQCIRKGWNGIPAMHLIPIDPLFVPEINIIQGSNSPVNIRLNLKNANFIGFSAVEITRITGFDKDPNKSNIKIQCRIPKLSIIGHYKVGGRVIVLPVVGEGSANLTFVHLDVSIKFDPRVESKNGKEYLQFNNVDVDFSTTRLHLNFENLFRGDSLLGQTTNDFLNENWTDILNELKQVLRDTIGGIIKNVVGSVFGAFPYVDLFLE